MSTRSLIGVQIPDSNIIEYIYVHWDGYLSHSGKILMNHYYSFNKALELINLGSFSSLEESIKDITPYKDEEGGWEVDNEDQFRFTDHGSEFKYLFKNHKWYFTTGSFPFVELTLDACK
jgi:hypothetical protein